MVAFHDTRLTEDIEKESTVGPAFFTSVTRLSNGAEARNQNWQDAKLKADISYGVQRATDGWAAVLAFFRARRGRLYAFRFKDWSDYQAVNVSVGIGDGSTKAFQLTKTYADAVLSYVRPIQLPVAGTLFVYVNGVLSTSYTVALGVVTFSSAPASGAAISASFEFDTPMRFDNDELSLAVETADATAVQSITLTEVRL